MQRRYAAFKALEVTLEISLHIAQHSWFVTSFERAPHELETTAQLQTRPLDAEILALSISSGNFNRKAPAP